MTRERKAKLATVAILACALGLVMARRGGWQAGAAPLANWITATRPNIASPSDTIYRMMDAARDGDVSSYLACYTGSMERMLRQLVTEKGEASMADYIRRFNASVKGVAVQEPQPIGEQEARVRVEFVYSDRNEAQLYYFQKAGGGWKIARQEDSQGVKAILPYGAPVE